MRTWAGSIVSGQCQSWHQVSAMIPNAVATKQSAKSHTVARAVKARPRTPSPASSAPAVASSSESETMKPKQRWSRARAHRSSFFILEINNIQAWPSIYLYDF